MAVFPLTFLYYNCLHTWLVCLYQIVSNLSAGICLISHCSLRCTTGTRSVVVEPSSQKRTTMDKTCPCVFAVMVELPPQPPPLYNCSPQSPAHASHARDHATQHPSQVLGGKDHSKWPRRGVPTPRKIWRGAQHTCAENMLLSLLISPLGEAKGKLLLENVEKHDHIILWFSCLFSLLIDKGLVID